jgi:hypothetical protein
MGDAVMPSLQFALYYRNESLISKPSADRVAVVLIPPVVGARILFSCRKCPGGIRSAPRGSSPPAHLSIGNNLGNPKTGGDWIVHIAGAIVAIFLVWWMLRLYVL